MTLSGIKIYSEVIQSLQNTIIDTQSEVLSTVAAAMVETIIAQRLIFLFGTGHSHMLAEEGHYRAGSLAVFVPILMPGIMLHESAAKSGQLERTTGLAAPLLENYHPNPGDMLFIFSNSGVNAMPVEMALAARERQMIVVSISSLTYARTAPLSPIGKRLDEVADYVIDNGIAPGDAIVPLDHTEWRVAPASTIIGSFILNCLVAETAFRLHESGHEIPVFISSNMAGASEHNQHLLATWGKYNPHI